MKLSHSKAAARAGPARRALLALLALAAAASFTGCAGPGGPGAAPATTRAIVYKRVDPPTLGRALAADGSVRPAALAPAVGAGMAGLVAESLQELVAGTDLGRSLRSSTRGVYAYVLRTEDDRDVTVLSASASYPVGACVNLFEAPGRRDYPRLAPARGCLGAR